MQSQERRRYERIKKILFVLCRRYDSSDLWSSVIIQDISEAGMSFVGDKEFKVGEVLEIKIVTLIRRGQAIFVVSNVVGSEEKQQGKRWITHVSITQINEEDKPIFQECIQMFLKEAKKGVRE